MNMREIDARALTSFDRLITPKIIDVLFWIGVVASILVGLGMIAIGGFGVFLGLAVLVAGPILTRVLCEVLLLAFKTFDWIGEIKTVLAKQDAPPATADGRRSAEVTPTPASRHGV